MRSIFVKLFVAFMLTSVASGVVFFLLAFNLRLGPMSGEHGRKSGNGPRHIQTDTVTLYARTVAAAYESGGAAALPGAQAGAHPGGMATAVYLFAPDGTPLSYRVPAAVGDAVRRKLAGSEQPADADVVLIKVAGPSGKPYLAAAGSPQPMMPKMEHGVIPPNFWLQMLVTFVISGAVCYLISWRITAPVRRLRAAAQGLAGGELGSRVPVESDAGGDELAELGRDFNQMAARIESLVTSHKQLVRDVSHELRSPLARLNVALGIARQQSSASVVGALDRIELEGERLNALIGELLGLSQLESGAVAAGAEFDLAGLVEEVVRDADFEARAVSRQVLLLRPPELTVRGNRELLRRAVENVVRNAVRHTAEGTTVEVSLTRTARPEALLLVRDRGTGVPDAMLEDIFRPFFRVAEARDRQSGGTGIGLAITERTVKLHDGSVLARNVDGAGLEVEIRLPCEKG